MATSSRIRLLVLQKRDDQLSQAASFYPDVLEVQSQSRVVLLDQDSGSSLDGFSPHSTLMRSMVSLSSAPGCECEPDKQFTGG